MLKRRMGVKKNAESARDADSRRLGRMRMTRQEQRACRVGTECSLDATMKHWPFTIYY